MNWLSATLTVFCFFLFFGVCGGVEQSATINDDIWLAVAALLAFCVFVWVRKRSKR